MSAVQALAQVIANHDQIAPNEASLTKPQGEIKRKNKGVESLVIDCNRMMQEHSDIAAVKRW